MAGEIKNKTSKSNNKDQGIFILLFLFSLLALFLGYKQISNDIKLPFAIDLLNQPLPDFFSNINSQDLALNKQDTDNDGLSDYNEINVLGTSPYLADTDSDGYNDKIELDSKNNPNCPAHQTCLTAPVNLSAGTIAPRTTADLREALRQAGVAEDQLSKIDDQTLLDLYNEVSQTPADDNTGTTASTTTSPLTEEQKNAIKKLSASELREFLKQSGASAEVIDKLDDEALKSLVNQALGQ